MTDRQSCPLCLRVRPADASVAVLAGSFVDAIPFYPEHIAVLIRIDMVGFSLFQQSLKLIRHVHIKPLIIGIQFFHPFLRSFYCYLRLPVFSLYNPILRGIFSPIFYFPGIFLPVICLPCIVRVYFHIDLQPFCFHNMFHCIVGCHLHNRILLSFSKHRTAFGVITAVPVSDNGTLKPPVFTITKHFQSFYYTVHDNLRRIFRILISAYVDFIPALRQFPLAPILSKHIYRSIYIFRSLKRRKFRRFLSCHIDCHSSKICICGGSVQRKPQAAIEFPGSKLSSQTALLPQFMEYAQIICHINPYFPILHSAFYFRITIHKRHKIIHAILPIQNNLQRIPVISLVSCKP